jgi:hypothetical protein
VPGYRVLSRGENRVESPMQVVGERKNRAADAMGGLAVLAKGLLWPYGGIAAVDDIFFVRFAPFVLVNVTSVEHSLREVEGVGVNPGHYICIEIVRKASSTDSRLWKRMPSRRPLRAELRGTCCKS